MADVSRGPVSSMPGSVRGVDEGTMCDDHPDRPAVRRVQGETDSFGCEYVDMCQECLDKYHAYREQERQTPRYCQWCKCMKIGVRPHRDMDEGMSGPLYDVCGDCISKELDAIHAELEEYGNDPGDWDASDVGDSGDDPDDWMPKQPDSGVAWEIDHRADELEEEERQTDVAVAQHHHEPPNVAPVITYKRRRTIVKGGDK